MKRVVLLSMAGMMCIFSACKQSHQEAEVARTVKVDTVRVYGEKESVTFPGKVKAAEEVNLSFRISGPVLKMYVKTGKLVRRGDVLAIIDPRDYNVQLAATEAEYKRIKAEAERIIALYEKGSVPPNDYDKAVYGLDQITALYDAHKNALADTRLTAPFDGYIQDTFFDAGETVGAGMPVISMISRNLPEIEINIPSYDFINRDKFGTFSCTVDSYPEEVFPLELVGIAQKANLNQLYTMRLRIKGSYEQLPTPGMSTIVTIQYRPEETGMYSIPLTAVFETDRESHVWVYNTRTQTVEKRKVNIKKILTDGTVVLSEGVRAGEVIVTAGVQSLKENDSVRPLPQVSPTNIGGLL